MTEIDKPVSFFRNGDYTSALIEFEALSASGNAEAKYWLGNMYLWGEGCEVDREKGIRLLKESAPEIENAEYILEMEAELSALRSKADSGDADAQYELAWEIYNRGLSELYEQRLIELAANGGNRAAQEELAKNGDKKWIIELAKQGDASSRYALAMLYLKGDDTQRNKEKAISDLKDLACENYPIAQHQLYELMIEKNPPNTETAIYFLRRAAENNYGPSQFFMAENFRNGFLIKKDIKSAISFYKLCINNYSTPEQMKAAAYLELGTLYWHGHDGKIEIRKAISCFNSASSIESDAARKKLQGLYNFYVSKVRNNLDLVTDAKYTNEFAKAGVPEALYTLGMILLAGILVKENIAGAYTCFLLASADGHPSATKWLPRIWDFMSDKEKSIAKSPSYFPNKVLKFEDTVFIV